MPIDYRAKLDLIESDPSFAVGINGRVPIADEFLAMQLGNDYQRYIEMRRDPQVRSKLDRRIKTILGRRLIIEPASDKRSDKKAAALAHTVVEAIGYESLCSALLKTGMLVGFAVVRLDVEPVGDLILPRWQFVPQSRFCFVAAGQDDLSVPVCTGENLKLDEIITVQGYELRLLTRRHPFTGERCPKGRFLLYRFDGEESPGGLGLGYSIFPWYTVKRQAMKAWLLHSDRIGTPPVVGKTPANFNSSNASQKATLNNFESFLRSLSPTGWGSFPAGFEVQALEGVAGESSIHKELIELANEEISKAALGEVSYSEKAVGGYAANVSQVEDRESSLIDGDCNLLDEQLLEQLWKPFFALNLPDAELPVIRRESRADQRQADALKEAEAAKQQRLDRDKKMVDLGYRVKPDRIAEVYGEEYELASGKEDSKPALTTLLDASGIQSLMGFLTQLPQLGLSSEVAIAILGSVFGIDKAQAKAMIPPEAEQEASASEDASEAIADAPPDVSALLEDDFAENQNLSPLDWLVSGISSQPVQPIDWLARQIYFQSDRSSFDFAAKRKNKGRVEKNCTTGYSCGYSCISRAKLCNSTLTGQAKTYADWLKGQVDRGAKLSPLHEAEAQNRGFVARERRRTAYADSWASSWDRSPDDLSAAIDRFDAPGRNQTKIPGINSAFYRRDQASIEMLELTPDTERGQAVWRHEYGHHLDRKIAETQNRSNLEFIPSASSLPYYSSTVEANRAFRADEAALLERRSQTESRHIAAHSELALYADHPQVRTVIRQADAENASTEDKVVAIGRAINRIKIEQSVDDKVDVIMRSNVRSGQDAGSAEALRRQILQEQIDALPSNSLTRQLYNQLPEDSRSRRSFRAIKILADADDPEVVVELAEEVMGDRSSRSIRDLVGSTTLNRVSDGHSDDYYLGYDNPAVAQNSEAFANLIGLHGSGHPIVSALLQNLSPNGYQLMLNSLTKDS